MTEKLRAFKVGFFYASKLRTFCHMCHFVYTDLKRVLPPLISFGAAQAKIKRNIKKLFSLAARPSLALFRRDARPFYVYEGNAYVEKAAAF